MGETFKGEIQNEKDVVFYCGNIHANYRSVRFSLCDKQDNQYSKTDTVKHN